MTYREAIRKALFDEMTSDENVFLMGEDIGKYGGCFHVTQGLFDAFPERVLDTPVSEEAFTGLAVGCAMLGLRPVVEVMYADFYTLIIDPLVNHACKVHFMSGGAFSCPLVIRLPEGSGTGHGPQHTQSPQAVFFNEMGLKIFAPSNANDAYHLLRMAIRDNNPVLFFENKVLYDKVGEISKELPENMSASVISIPGLDVGRSNPDLVIISYSSAVYTAINVAERLGKKGISSAVIDLRILKPLDKKTILKYAGKAGRVAVIQDAPSDLSMAPHIASVIGTDEKLFGKLKRPVLLLGGSDIPVPFSKELEKNVKADEEKCYREILKKLFQ